MLLLLSLLVLLFLLALLLLLVYIYIYIYEKGTCGVSSWGVPFHFFCLENVALALAKHTFHTKHMVDSGETPVFKTSVSPRPNTTFHLNVLFRCGETQCSACGFQVQPVTRISKTIEKTKETKGTRVCRPLGRQKPSRKPKKPKKPKRQDQR